MKTQLLRKIRRVVYWRKLPNGMLMVYYTKTKKFKIHTSVKELIGELFISGYISNKTFYQNKNKTKEPNPLSMRQQLMYAFTIIMKYTK